MTISRLFISLSGIPIEKNDKNPGSQKHVHVFETKGAPFFCFWCTRWQHAENLKKKKNVFSLSTERNHYFHLYQHRCRHRHPSSSTPSPRHRRHRHPVIVGTGIRHRRHRHPVIVDISTPSSSASASRHRRHHHPVIVGIGIPSSSASSRCFGRHWHPYTDVDANIPTRLSTVAPRSRRRRNQPVITTPAPPRRFRP